MTRLPASLAALNGLLAVAFGTSGAHLVSDAHARDLLMLAATFELSHAAAALGVLALLPGRIGRGVALLLGAGALVFGMALAVLAFGGPRWMGAVAPAGGTLMFVGWVLLFGRLATLQR